MDNMATPISPRENWLDAHSHQFSVAPKPIDVDGVLYMPGVYESGLPNEDWAKLYQELGGEG